MVEAIRRNFPQREIADAAFTYQRELDERRRIVVGVNDFVQEDEEETPILRSTRRWNASRSTASQATRAAPRRRRGRERPGRAEARRRRRGAT